METRDEIIRRMAEDCAEEALRMGLDPDGDRSGLPTMADAEACYRALQKAGLPAVEPTGSWPYPLDPDDEATFVRAYHARLDPIVPPGA